MRLQPLLATGDAPADVVRAADELVALKAVTHELGTGIFPPVLRAFVLDELAAADLPEPPRRRMDVDHARTLATDTFRTAVQELASR